MRDTRLRFLTHRGLHGHVDFLGGGAVSLKEEVSVATDLN